MTIADDLWKRSDVRAALLELEARNAELRERLEAAQREILALRSDERLRDAERRLAAVLTDAREFRELQARAASLEAELRLVNDNRAQARRANDEALRLRQAEADELKIELDRARQELRRAGLHAPKQPVAARVKGAVLDPDIFDPEGK